MTRTARLLAAISAIALAGLFIVPLWRIELAAPQYPEGLGMQISIRTVRGVTPNDLDNINALNHYIGMKHITPDTIPELRIMPWLVGGLVLFGLVAAVAGRRRLLYAWASAFLLLAVAGLADFWRWEYDYGHNIDYDHAIIKVPGMIYQPPLIGVKQLLNFTAVSWPDIGGWLAAFAFVLSVAAVLITLRTSVRESRA